MDGDGAKQPSVSGLLDPTTQTNQKKNPKRRCCCPKSALLADNVLPDINGIVQLPHPESIFGKLHPSFYQVAVYLAAYLGVGTICFYLLRHQMKGKKTNGVLDAVYFCIVTMATVGYGDLVPSSVLTKLLACAFVFTGMALVGLILSKAADYLVEKQGILLVKALLIHQEVCPTEILKKLGTNKVRYKCVMVLLLLFVLIIVGTIFVAFVEEMNVVDSFYCVCSTITTLGYGDKSFSTQAGRVFAVFWILTSTICSAQFFLYVAELNTERKRRSLVKWVLTRRITKVELQEADIDRDGFVGKSEFILHKLKEMGKISPEDISLILEKFQDLDVDQTGTLSASEIVAPAQSSEPGK
ncbi:hypothetical protein L1049_000875 [Liquidambar formosana]|uniref:Potassium channel domain-containing protein n=1 Tax=Liquidambar formosana TaxID=63359 RepID=A0AAP0NBT5_LIQFO